MAAASTPAEGGEAGETPSGNGEAGEVPSGAGEVGEAGEAGGAGVAGVPVALVTGRPLAVPDARAALSTSLAFGGSNAALVFRRWVDP
jgi:hypothetical protein